MSQYNKHGLELMSVLENTNKFKLRNFSQYKNIETQCKQEKS